MTGPDLVLRDGSSLASSGTVSRGEAEFRDLNRREVGSLAPLFLALVLFGFYPMPLLKVINPYVQDTLQHVGVHDPAPTVAVSDTAQGGQQ